MTNNFGNTGPEKLIRGGQLFGPSFYTGRTTFFRPKNQFFRPRIPTIIGHSLRCPIGECKVTDTIGCKLNCNYVFHTVGPKVDDNNQLAYYKELLVRCYKNCLQNVLEHNIKSIVFPCISTGIFKYDNRQAAHVALNTVRLWLELNQSHIEQVVFCTYKDKDFELYKELMCEYFPTSGQCETTLKTTLRTILFLVIIKVLYL